MRLKKYNFIYEYDNEEDEISKLLNNSPDLVEYEEEGYLDMDCVVAVSRHHDLVQVYLLGGHNVILGTSLEEFLTDWTQ